MTPTLVTIQSLRPATLNEQMGVCDQILGGPEVEVAFSRPLPADMVADDLSNWNQPGRHFIPLSSVPGDHVYRFVRQVDFEFDPDRWSELGLTRIKTKQPIQRLHFHPTGPEIPTYDDVTVKCDGCAAEFPDSQLQSDSCYEGDEYGENWSNTICPRCGMWDCCVLRLETIPEYKARVGAV